MATDSGVAVEFRVLGPLEVVRNGETMPLPSGRVRRLLTLLLLHANEVVPVDRLAEELWSGEPPESATAALQVHVSRLRRLLETGGGGPPLLVTRRPGYLLRLTLEQYDVLRFEDRVTQGRQRLVAGDASGAVELFGEASRLWRGSPFADIADEPFVASTVGRLEQVRRAAIEDRIDAELVRGRHRDVVAELDQMVSQDPLNERLRGQLMLVLYRCGRQADALRAYQKLRKVLADELGIEPSPELRRLEEAVLLQKPELEWVPPVVTVGGVDEAAASASAPDTPSAAGTADGEPFVGRTAELATLEQSLARMLAGRGQLALVVGEPGIGKSRLVREFTRRAEERRVLVLWGRCHDGDGPPPYWPWVQVLRAYVARGDPAGRVAKLVSQQPDLARVLPELASPPPEPAFPGSATAGDARSRLFDALTALLEVAAAVGPTVVVIDDLQWADHASLLVLNFLAREMAASRLMVVATYRDSDAVGRAPLGHTLGVLAGEAVTVRIALDGLGEDDVARYIEAATGVRSSPVTAVVRRRTAGNPFFMSALVSLLESEGLLLDARRCAEATSGIPPNVREVVRMRSSQLSADGRQLVSVASVFGQDLRLDALQAVAGLDEDRLIEALEETMAAGLIVEDPTTGAYRFSHDLVRECLYRDLSAIRRARLHRRVGETLHSSVRSASPPEPADIARHLLLGIPAGADVTQAIEAGQRAAERATTALAYEDAVAHYVRTLDALDTSRTDDPSLRADLLVSVGEARWRAGESAAARETFLRAVELARTLPEPRRLARAVLGLGGGLFRDWHASRGETNEALVPLLEEALTAMGDHDDPLRVRLLGHLAEELYYSPLLERRLDLSQQAVDMARRLDDPATYAHALASRCLALWSPEFLADRLTLTRELVDLGEQIGNAELTLFGRHYLFVALMELGDVGDARDTLDAFEQLAERVGQPLYLWVSRWLRALEALFDGRFTDAERLCIEAYELGEAAGDADAINIFGVQLGLLRMEQGRLAEMEPLVREFSDQFPETPAWRAALCFIEGERGHLDEAREHLDALAAHDFTDLPHDFSWLAGLALLTLACQSLGDDRRAAQLYVLLEPFADRNVMTADRNCWGAASHYLGVLAATKGDAAAAARWFEVALERNRQMRTPPWVAHTLHEYGRLLVTSGDADDAHRGEALLAEARTIAHQLGMTRLLNRIATR